MSIKAIGRFLSPSRVYVSRRLKKRGFDYLKCELNKTAYEKDVYVRIFESKKNPALFTMQIFRHGYDHVADIPEYAVKHQTGDTVYIAREKDVVTKDVDYKLANMLDFLKEY